jgi:hypothetical protein
MLCAMYGAGRVRRWWVGGLVVGRAPRHRLVRKAELARVSRKRKKEYVTEMEDKVNALTSRIAELEEKQRLQRIKRERKTNAASASSASASASASAAAGSAKPPVRSPTATTPSAGAGAGAGGAVAAGSAGVSPVSTGSAGASPQSPNETLSPQSPQSPISQAVQKVEFLAQRIEECLGILPLPLHLTSALPFLSCVGCSLLPLCAECRPRFGRAFGVLGIGSVRLVL